MRGGACGVRAAAKHARPPSLHGWAEWPAGEPASTDQRHGPAPGRPGEPVAADPLTGPVAITEQAVFGNQIRRPVVWCEIGPCIARYEDPAALGEADIRSHAIGAGWRHDAVGRLACPHCQQHSPQLWAAYPVVHCASKPAGERCAPSSHARPGRLVAVGQAVTAWYRNFNSRQGERTGWPDLLAALASGVNGSKRPPILSPNRPTSPPRHRGDDHRRNFAALSGVTATRASRVIQQITPGRAPPPAARSFPRGPATITAARAHTDPAGDPLSTARPATGHSSTHT